MGMIDKLFGQYAAVVSMVLMFATGGCVYIGMIDAETANAILIGLGVHGTVSKLRK